jgi:fructokinase
VRIGIDLGGTKIEAIALGVDGAQLWRHRVPTPHGDYHGIVRCIVDLVDQLEQATGQVGSIGVGAPGSVSMASGLMKNCNSTVLNGRAFGEDLARALGRPIQLANDANCFTLSEAIDGAGKDLPTVFGVILGTGVGGGLVVDRQLLIGPNAICGEWGHNPMPGGLPTAHTPRACYCGRNDCIETWLCGPAFELSYFHRSGIRRSAAEIAGLAQTGDAASAECYQRYVDRLARALATVINIVDPFVIVLGGGMSNIDSLYRDVPQRWGRYIFSDHVDTRLQRALHGDSSGVRGAAWLWPANPSDV